MTLNITLIDPATHRPSELRALAHFLNVLAANAEGKPVEINTSNPAAVAGPLAPSGAAVHSASGGEGSAPAVNANSADSPSSDDLDSAGVRWDERIHSQEKTKNADQTWRKKRGVDPKLVDEVLAEQKAASDTQGDDLPPDVPEETEEAPEVPADDDSAPDVPEDTPPPAEDVKPAEVLRFITDNKIATEAACGILESLDVEGLKKPADLFVLAAKNPGLAAQALEAIKALV